MKPVQIAEVRAERKGIITPFSLIENLMDNIDTVQDVVFVIRRHDGEMVHGVSTMNHIESLGLFEVGKALVLNDMWEEVE